MLFATLAIFALATSAYARTHLKRHDHLSHRFGNRERSGATGTLDADAARSDLSTRSSYALVPLSAFFQPAEIATVRSGVERRALQCTNAPQIWAASRPGSCTTIFVPSTTSVWDGGRSITAAGAISQPYSGITESVPPSADGSATTAGGPNPTASSTNTSGLLTIGKRGLPYNDPSLTLAFAGKGISWVYNWGQEPDGAVVSGAEFVPMLWGLRYTNGWNAAARSAIDSGSTHLLSFNEPDQSSQSNMSPSVAAANHIIYMNPLAGNGVQIGSPAITNGLGTNPPMGIAWLSQFITACAGNCKIDFVDFHWYNTADSIQDFKQHVQDVINATATAGIPKVWLTEFQASGTDSDVEAFLAEALPFLDSNSAVERYAYFMCATGPGNLVDGDSLSNIGLAYVS